MPVYLFTYHAYRSWMPDHQRGYVQHGRGIRKPSVAMAARYAERARGPRVYFDEEQQRALIVAAREVCTRLNWRLHAIQANRTHVHVLLSWREYQPWLAVFARVKNILSLHLGRQAGVKGRPWFARKGSRKRVRDPRHFTHLCYTYLPGHRQGICRCEGARL